MCTWVSELEKRECLSEEERLRNVVRDEESEEELAVDEHCYKTGNCLMDYSFVGLKRTRDHV